MDLVPRRVIGSDVQFGYVFDFLVQPQALVVLDVKAIASEASGEVIDDVPAQRPRSATSVMLVDKASGATLRAYGRSGQGPGEIQRPAALARDAVQDSLVWVLDVGNSTLVGFDLRHENPLDALEIRLPAPTILGLHWLDGRTFLGSTFKSDSLARRYELDDDERVSDGDEFGDPPFPRAPAGTRFHLNRHVMTLSPDRKRVALAFIYSDRLRVLATDGQALASPRGPEEVEPVLALTDTKVASTAIHTEETRIAYVGIDSSDKHIYALFSGRAIGEHGTVGASHASSIHVLTWSGDLVANLRLPNAVSMIRLDGSGGDDTTLWALQEDPWPRFIEFSLPAILTGS